MRDGVRRLRALGAGDEPPPRGAGAVLALEHLFWDRTALAGGRPARASEAQGGAPSLAAPALADLAELRRRPFALSKNAVLDSVAEAEVALLALLAAVDGPVVLCETSPAEWAPGRLELIEEVLGRLKDAERIKVVFGTGWAAAPGAAPAQVDQLAARFEADVVSTGASLIGEIAIANDVDAGERSAIQAAAVAQQRIRARNPEKLAPPVLLSLADDLSGPADFGRLGSVAEDAIQTYFASAAAETPSLAPELWIAGLVEAAPGIHLGLAGLEAAVDTVAKLLASRRVGLVVAARLRGPCRSVVAFCVAELCRRGFAGQVMLTGGVSFRTDLLQYGGDGYAAAQAQLVPLLLEAGMSRQDLERLTTSNALSSLAWYVRPPPPPKTKRPRWPCDGPCGKTYSAKREPFTRMGFKYCSMACLNTHRDELDKDKDGDGGNNDGGGGRRARAGGGTGWGISVSS